jgi:hypothetical protein
LFSAGRKKLTANCKYERAGLKWQAGVTHGDAPWSRFGLWKKGHAR